MLVTKEEKMKSVKEINDALTKLKMNDPVRFPAVKKLKGYLVKYLTEDAFNVTEIIPFVEFNREIYIQLSSKNVHNNKIILKVFKQPCS